MNHLFPSDSWEMIHVATSIFISQERLLKKIDAQQSKHVTVTSFFGQATDFSLDITGLGPVFDKSKSISLDISSFWNQYCKHLSASAVKCDDIHGAVLSWVTQKNSFWGLTIIYLLQFLLYSTFSQLISPSEHALFGLTSTCQTSLSSQTYIYRICHEATNQQRHPRSHRG